MKEGGERGPLMGAQCRQALLRNGNVVCYLVAYFP